MPFTSERHAACPYHAALIERRSGEIVYLCLNPAEAGHIRQRQAWERDPELISPEGEEQRQQAEATERQRADRRESLEVATKVRHDFTRELLQRPGLGGKAAALDAARFVVAAMWEFIADAYNWGADEVGEFADLIGVDIDEEPTWGQQHQAITAAIREKRRVDDLAGVLLAMHAVRIEPTLADEDWSEDGVALVAFLTSQGYQPSPIEAELMGRIVPMQPHEASSPDGEQPSAEEDAST